MSDVLLKVAECYSLGEVGVVICGTIEAGTLRVGDRIRLIKDTQRFEADVRRLEIFRKIEPVAHPGDYVGFHISPQAGSQWQGAEVRKMYGDVRPGESGE